jgi:hypothetical protein
MADTKITALTALTAADPINDAIPIVDVSDTSMAASGTTKRISVNNILSSSPTASGALTVTGLVTAGSATITGALDAARLNVTGATIPANGVYLGSANNLSFSANSTLGMTLNSTGLGVGISPAYKFHAVVTSGAVGAFRATTAAIARLLVGNTVEDVELKVNANGDGQLTANASKYLGLGSGGINDRVVLDTSGNLLVGLTTAGTTAAKTIQIANGTAPTANVTGGQLYVESGVLKYRGSSGTITTLGAA